MRVLGRGNHHRVHILQRQQLLWMPERTGRFAVVPLVGRNGSLEIVTPQVADRCHLHVFLVFEKRYDAVEFAAATADTDMPQRDPFVRPGDARIRTAPCCSMPRFPPPQPRSSAEILSG